MTNELESKLWFDNYTNILHIGKIMITICSNWELSHSRVDANKSHYFRIGRIAVRL